MPCRLMGSAKLIKIHDYCHLKLVVLYNSGVTIFNNYPIYVIEKLYGIICFHTYDVDSVESFLVFMA